jgi:hypothetical protein
MVILDLGQLGCELETLFAFFKIVELRIDPEGESVWCHPKHMFVDDAYWFIVHAQCMHMAICTPSSLAIYNIFEGPNYFAADKETGKVEEHRISLSMSLPNISQS